MIFKEGEVLMMDKIVDETREQEGVKWNEERKLL